MADNLKAQAFLYLSQIEPENVGNIKNAFSLIKSVMEMNLDPDTNNMNLFRQLASAKAILFELQLLDKKLTKEFPLKGTQQFYEKFGAHLEPFLKTNSPTSLNCTSLVGISSLFQLSMIIYPIDEVKICVFK